MLLDSTNFKGSDGSDYKPEQIEGDFDEDNSPLINDDSEDFDENLENEALNDTQVNDNDIDEDQYQDPGLRQNVSDFAKGKLQKKAGNLAVDKVGDKLGISDGMKDALKTDSPENRERVKEEAKQRARKAIADKVGSNSKFGKEFGGSLQKGAKGIVKDAMGDIRKARQAASEAKNVATAAKTAKNVATAAKTAKTGVSAAKTAIAAAGAASAPETLGLGALAAFLLDIAISLGIEDAIDMAFELKNGNIPKAKFHAQRAYTSIGMSLWLLVGAVLTFSVAGFIFAVPIMLGVSLYTLMGFMFPGVGFLQGLNRWWQLAIIFLIDVALVIIVASVIAGIAFGICTESAIGSLLGYGGLIGDAISYVDTNYGTGGSIAGLNEMCKAVGNFK